MTRSYNRAIWLALVLTTVTGINICDPSEFSPDAVDVAVVMDEIVDSATYAIRELLMKSLACSRPNNFAFEGWHIHARDNTCDVRAGSHAFGNLGRIDSGVAGENDIKDRSLCGILETALKCPTKNRKIKDVIVTLGPHDRIGYCNVAQLLDQHKWHLTVFWLRPYQPVPELDLPNVDIIQPGTQDEVLPQPGWFPDNYLIDSLANSGNTFGNSLGALYAKFVGRTLIQVETTPSTTADITTTTKVIPTTTLRTTTLPTTSAPATTQSTTTNTISETTLTSTVPPTTTPDSDSVAIVLLPKDPDSETQLNLKLTSTTDKLTTITTSKLASTTADSTFPPTQTSLDPRSLDPRIVPFIKYRSKDTKNTKTSGSSIQPLISSTPLSTNTESTTNSSGEAMMVAMSSTEASLITFLEEVFTFGRTVDTFYAGLLWGTFIALLILFLCFYCCYSNRSGLRGNYNIIDAENGILDQRTEKLKQSIVPRTTDTEAMGYCPMPMEFRRTRSFIQRTNTVYTPALSSPSSSAHNAPELLSMSAINEPMDISTVREEVYTSLPMSSASMIHTPYSEKMQFNQGDDLIPIDLSIRPEENEDLSEDGMNDRHRRY